jgi:2-keto-4-pentenoate hydratase/2-oxohepta-3-ene-1,7-dioic acid hydratase in catechol pathway
VQLPGKIVCVGQNYRAHAAEMGGAEMAEPILFGKFAACVIGPGEPIVLPPESSHVDAEAELAVVIGKPARRVSRERALEFVAGYVCANDVSARDLQYGDGQWFRGKNFETFCPVGPGPKGPIGGVEPVPVSELGDGSGLRVVQRLNGEVLQDGSTSDLIFDVPYLVAFASKLFTLEPGDLVLTGTPSGVGWARDPRVTLRDGDVVEVEVEGIGALSSPVVGGAP